ncbi:hypothetical protein [Paenibacillus sp. MMS18-CY102]|uniref:hypothetical protein n=1 Tax=Paenibacillus sp. MMS18-CY102 TaxID=2682849 RepID=UPI0013661333|nr:hypothetical protein [Paenibacillus sp. MMS18-CY102]MWC27029.1 hypothetical protein [Paenibacillus sp. MMS18-CY102]
MNRCRLALSYIIIGLAIVSLAMAGGCAKHSQDVAEAQVQGISIFTPTAPEFRMSPTGPMMDQVSGLVHSSKACNKCPFETKETFVKHSGTTIVIKLNKQVAWTADGRVGDTLLIIPSKSNIAFGTEDKLLEYEAEQAQVDAAMSFFGFQQ